LTASRTDVAMRLHAAAIGLLRTVRAEDRQLGMSPARLSVLSILVFGGPRTVMQLTEAEQVAAPTMSKLISGLEAEGYIARKGDPADARVWLIRATAKAKRILMRGRDQRINALMKLLDGCSREDWVQLQEAVMVLERVLAKQRG
jgi:DNA-binding MarR family transcriptional regulator